MVVIQQLSAEQGRRNVGALADVLLDCVRGGASVSFMASLTKAGAEAFFNRVVDGVETGDRILLAAFIDSQLVGTVQVIDAPAPNQPHRADVAKLLVHRAARQQGVASQLMRQAEQASRARGRRLLVLDTVTGDPAEKLYVSLGWKIVGVISRYALYPDGRLCDTTIFWKEV